MPKFVKATFYAESFLHSADERLSTQRFTSHSVDKALDGSQKRKKRKVLDKSRGLVRITHRVVFEEQR